MTAVVKSMPRVKWAMCSSDTPVMPSPMAISKRGSTDWVKRPTMGSASSTTRLPGESTRPLSKAV